MKILILSISGILGNSMLRKLSEMANIEVFGTARSEPVKRLFPLELDPPPGFAQKIAIKYLAITKFII